MIGGVLFRLAEAVGLSQYRVAQCLGVARTQTNIWKQGHRAIPDDRLPVLLTIVGQAVDAALAAIDAEPPSLREAITRERAQRKATILALCKDLSMELLEHSGVGPSAMVCGSLASLKKFEDMTPEELRKGDTPAELVEAATRLVEATKLFQRLEPLQRILDRESSTSTQAS